jgi:hypothetical protein
MEKDKSIIVLDPGNDNELIVGPENFCCNLSLPFFVD